MALLKTILTFLWGLPKVQPALAQICSLNSPFAADIEEYAAGQCRFVEVWLTKLEQYVADHSVEAARELLTAHAVEAPVASLQGGLLSSQGEARQLAWQLFRRRLDLIRDIGAKTIVVACDVPAPLQQSDLERVRVSLSQAAQEAGRREMQVALEFQADAAFGNNLQTAAALVAEVGSPHLGLCFDLFHFAVGPSKLDDLAYLSRSNLFHVQISDLADTPRELARDADRILPGDGDLANGPLLQRLREIDYQGLIAVETMNPQLWQVPPRQFGEIAMTALRKVLDQASM